MIRFGISEFLGNVRDARADHCCHDWRVDIGDELIYRSRTYGPSERVKIVGIEKRKQSTRVDVEFLDGDTSGVRENIPGARLHGPWSGVAEYDALMANWHRLDEATLDDAEQWAVEEVFMLLVPDDAATYDYSMVRHGVTVHDRGALQGLIHRPLDDVLVQVEWFDHNGEIELSAEGALLVAEYVCRADPAPVLEQLMNSEAEIREHCKRGREYDAIAGSGKQTSTPEWEYERYRKRLRPVHELLRAWCGHRSVTFVERLTAAEAEIRRLDILVAEVIDALRKHETIDADIFEREHNNERIRPETIRPVIDRPLAPWELPVREVPARSRGRWW